MLYNFRSIVYKIQKRGVFLKDDKRQRVSFAVHFVCMALPLGLVSKMASVLVEVKRLC